MKNKLKNAKILITGGAGFIGSHFVDRLVKEEAKVTVLDNLFTGRKENIAHNLNKINFIKGSVSNYSLVEKLVIDSDIILHLAVRHIMPSVKFPREDFKANILGTFNVLVAAKNNPHLKKIIYTSSVSIYGNSDDLPFKENTLPVTLYPYAAGKFAGECYCKAFYESYGLPIATLRYSNIYGPRQTFGGYGGVVSKFFASAIQKTPFLIYGDGNQTRDFIFIDDVIKATFLTMISPKSSGEVFNIGTGQEVSINELASKIADLYKNNLKLKYIKKREVDDIHRRVLDNQKIKKKLGWSPVYSLEAGLRKTKKWFDENFSRYK